MNRTFLIPEEEREGKKALREHQEEEINFFQYKNSQEKEEEINMENFFNYDRNYSHNFMIYLSSFFYTLCVLKNLEYNEWVINKFFV